MLPQRAASSTAREEGLILLSSGVHGNTIHIMCPLNVQFELLTEGIGRLRSALSAAR
jgi:4-aminobutyrate aminotransferase/(S)-3-amino-2-methylpropionate transaminase